MRDNASPEEKLLKLIRGQKKQAIPLDKEPQGPLQPAALDSKANFRPQPFFQFRKSLSFLSLRKIIPLFFAASCVYLANSFIYPWLGAKKNKFPQTAAQKINLPDLEAGREVRPYEFYSEGIRNRKIFASTPAAEEQETEKLTSAENLSLIKDISLVGIIAGENPQAVIEDKKAQKTYYLAKGQSLGVFQVKDIQEGKVILNYNGQNYELYI